MKIPPIEEVEILVDTEYRPVTVRQMRINTYWAMRELIEKKNNLCKGEVKRERENKK
jgi:hypothetical protein